MTDTLLTILENDAKLTAEQIAVMTKKKAADVKDAIAAYEKDGTIIGYKTLIDWDKTDREFVCAMVELKVVPQQNDGYDRMAEMIVHFPEVKSVYLMSGAYDLQVVIEGKSLKEVAQFVASKLSTIKGVTSTATHFVLKKYKDYGMIYESAEEDMRNNLQ